MSDDAAFRAAVPADLPMILRAERAYIRAVEPRQEPSWTAAIDRNLALWINNLSRTSIVEAAGTAAGFVMWAAMEGVATIVTVQVLPAYRRRGLARELLALAAAQALQDGFGHLALGVHRDNAGAMALYEGEGFTRGLQNGDYTLYRRNLADGPVC